MVGFEPTTLALSRRCSNQLSYIPTQRARNLSKTYGKIQHNTIFWLIWELKLHVQYGCGHSFGENWRNFDASPTLRIERIPFLGRFVAKNKQRFPTQVEYGDILKGLPIARSSCDAIYCSHVLEHLSLYDFRSALQQTHRHLKPGGIFRLVVPDLEQLASNYLNNESIDAATEFLKELEMGTEKHPSTLTERLSAGLGNSAHLWMWDFKSLSLELENAGFVQIRRASFGDSSDPMFAEVESVERWKDCLGIECRSSNSEQTAA